VAGPQSDDLKVILSGKELSEPELLRLRGYLHLADQFLTQRENDGSSTRYPQTRRR